MLCEVYEYEEVKNTVNFLQDDATPHSPSGDAAQPNSIQRKRTDPWFVRRDLEVFL